MKLNLPSTWTSQKIASLFLLSFLKTNKAKAGQAFENCLVGYNNIEISDYSYFLSFPFVSDAGINSGGTLIFCCPNNQCFSNSTCASIISSSTGFVCNKFDQSIYYCNGGLNGVGCGGVIGINPITTNTTLASIYCQSDLATVANYISTITPNGLSQGYAHWFCPTGSPCNGMSCDWDNGGWTCGGRNFQTCNTTDASGFFCNANCTFQWITPWPGSVNNNPFPTTAMSSTLITSSSVSSSSSNTITSFSSSIAPTNPTNNNSNLTIILPTTIGGSIIIATASGCYLIRKKRKESQQNRQLENNSQRGIELQEIITNQDDILAALKKLSPNQLRNLQKEDTTLSREITYYSPLLSKEAELNNLRGDYINKGFGYQDIEKDLDELLELENKIFIDDSRYLSEQQKNEIKSELIKKTPLTENELDHLCQLQTEIIKLKNKLAKQRRRLNHKEIQQINNYVVNIQQGHAFIGDTTIGDNADLSYNNSPVEISEESQQIMPQIQQPPKSYYQK